MRTINLLTGGTAVGLLGVAGILLLPTAVSSAPPPPPDKLSLTGHIRDFPPNSAHIDFQVNPSATPGARSCKNIQTTLDSEFKPVFIGNGKRINQEWRDSSNRKIAWCQPLISAPANMKDNVGSTNSNDNGGIHNATSFAQWFRDVPGVNMSRLWTINLNRQSDGSYLYDTNNFNPVDFQLFGNGFDEHNFYFTYEIICEFTAGPGLWLEFKGDDDFWLFLVGPGYEQGTLCLDHGGIAANREQRVDFDRYRTTSLPGTGQMVDGQPYKLYMFFAERCQPQSQFRLHTNIASLKVANEQTDTIFAAFD